jgi:hypothetical protein
MRGRVRYVLIPSYVRNNTFWGEAGNDTYLAGSVDLGGDVFNGGSGTSDAADYSARTAGITVSLNGMADDGLTDVNPGNQNIRLNPKATTSTATSKP